MTLARHKAPIVKLEPNRIRAVQAICYLLTLSKERSVQMTQYTIVKSLFLADRMHLNRFGRPITFDNYVAMENGPVPSFCYNLLKGEIDPKSIELSKLPWKREYAPSISKNAYLYTLSGNRHFDFDELSQSDLDALFEALTVVSSLSFQQLRKLTHDDPAYVNAWESDGGRKAYPMSYGLLFEAPDFERAEDLAFASKHC